MDEYIGRYRAERVVGSGAFASVWLALDETLGARVAIKVLAENWAYDEEIRGRFMEEARILWRADSDHIVRIHNVDQLGDGRPYFVMDYADGGTLADRMRQRAGEGRPWSIDEAVDISLAIADGLKVAHALGIVHRDLKPANVLFQSVPAHHGGTRAEKLILTDFGIAKSLARSRGTTISAGTPHYMPPEQLDGRVDERSDVYAAAVIAYELLAGRVPYPYETFRELIAAVDRADEPRRITAIRPDVPVELGRAVHTGLSLDVGSRWPTAAAWAGALASGRTGEVAAPAPERTIPSAGPAGAVLGAAAGAGAGATIAHGAQAPQAAWQPPQPPAAPQPAQAAWQPPPAGQGAQPPPVQPPGPPAPPGGQPPGGAGPPPPPAYPPPTGSGGGGRPWWKIVVPIAALVAVAGAAVGIVLALTGGTEKASAATELVLEPIASVGNDPFTASVVPTEGDDVETDAPPEDQIPASLREESRSDLLNRLLSGLNPPAGGASGLDLPALDLPRVSGQETSVSGSATGLYGGTNLLSVCDRIKLVRFLSENPDKARAWAQAQGIRVGEIEGFVTGLTDVILQVDTRVTNHGFRNGVANPIDSVLQAGTAVLVDSYGIPRVRCYCGNPLTPPRSFGGSTPKLRGTPWPGFVRERIIIIERTVIIPEFALDDVLAPGTFVYRLPATVATQATLKPRVIEDGSATTEAATTEPETTEPATTEPETTEPATTEPATTERPPSEDITSIGVVGASSEFPGGEFPAALSVDGDVTTSWFSGGSNTDGATTLFQWQIPDGQPVYIDAIGVIGNESHPDFPTGFGFAEVHIAVERGDQVVWEKTVDLAGTPDPNVAVSPRVEGDTIALSFSGHEDPTCGGFAELIVQGSVP